MKKTGKIVKCAKCGEEFYRRGKFIRKNKYHFCTRKCYREYCKEHPAAFGRKKRGKVVECENCGKEVYKPPAQLKRTKNHFCSRPCHFEWMKGRPSPVDYSSITKNSGYPYLRRAVKDSSCELCGYSRVVEMCHIVPKHKGGGYEEWNILFLCANHHRLFDRGRNKGNPQGSLTDAEFGKVREKVETAMRNTQKFRAKGGPPFPKRKKR